MNDSSCDIVDRDEDESREIGEGRERPLDLGHSRVILSLENICKKFGEEASWSATISIVRPFLGSIPDKVTCAPEGNAYKHMQRLG